MNKLYFYHKEGQLKVTTPFCEMSIKLENGADMECFIESLEYWGIRYEDMDKSFSGANKRFDKMRELAHALQAS